MSIVILEFEHEYYLMECPALVAENIKDYQAKFDNWLYNKSNDHGHWVTEESHPEWFKDDKSIKDFFEESQDGMYGVCFGAQDFVDWLNRFVLQGKNEKAKIISVHDIEERDDKNNAKFPVGYNYPHLFF